MHCNAAINEELNRVCYYNFSFFGFCDFCDDFIQKTWRFELISLSWHLFTLLTLFLQAALNMTVTASALISTSFDSASFINVPSASVCCGGQHTEWPVCLGSVIYFVIKGPGCTEWHQISLSTIQSRYIIQQRNKGCEHRRKRMTWPSHVFTEKRRSIRWTSTRRGDAEAWRRGSTEHTKPASYWWPNWILLSGQRACRFYSSGFLFENIGPTKIKKKQT